MSSVSAPNRPFLPLDTGHRGLIFASILAMLAVLALAALVIGTRYVPISDAIDAFLHYDPDNPDHIVIRLMRLPRLIAGVLVGAALAAGGALIQDMTRNPLADPGLLGVNAGASFGVVLAIWGLQMSDPGHFIWPALIGAGVAGFVVYSIGSAGSGSATPLRAILAGAALSALLFSLIKALLLVSRQSLDVYRFWIVGSLDGIGFDDITPLLPFFAVGFVAALAGARALDAILLGDDVARSLGVNLKLTRVWNTMTITCLCGAAVALAGPIGFVGLVVPHIARALFGVNSVGVVFFGALLGACLVLASDIVGRLVFAHDDLQVGVVIAFVGAPVLIWLIRRTRIMRQ